VVQKYCVNLAANNSMTGLALQASYPSVIVSAALNVRTEGLGIRATGRRWQVALDGHPLGTTTRSASPVVSPAPEGADVTLEERKYTLVSVRTFPKASEGWTIHFIERESRY